MADIPEKERGTVDKGLGGTVKFMPRRRGGPQGVVIHGQKVWELEEDVLIVGKAKKDTARKTTQSNRRLDSGKADQQPSVPTPAPTPTPTPSATPTRTPTPSSGGQPVTGYVIRDADRAILPTSRYSGFRQAAQGASLRPEGEAPSPSSPPISPWRTSGQTPPTPYPNDVAKLSAWLIRKGYVRQVTNLIPASWRSMSEEQLTRELASRFTEEQLAAQFKGLAAERQAIKGVARRGSLIAALVIGLIWARENVKHDEWDKAIAKVSATTISAALINRALYARDKTAAQIMERNAGRFGKWFQGVARTNRFVNRLSELGMVSIAGTLGLSGGGEFPSIPWDIIYEVDIDDPSTWKLPSQRLLDYGFNIWYVQKPTAAHPEAQAANMCLGTIYGTPIPILYGVIKDAFLPSEAY
jgi:hypothetical protein